VEQTVQKFVPKIVEVEQIIEIPRVEYKDVEGETTTEEVPMNVQMVQQGTVRQETVDGPDLEPVTMQMQQPMMPQPMMQMAQPMMQTVAAPTTSYVQAAPAVQTLAASPSTSYIQAAPTTSYAQPMTLAASPSTSYLQAAPAVEMYAAAPTTSYAQPMTMTSAPAYYY